MLCLSKNLCKCIFGFTDGYGVLLTTSTLHDLYYDMTTTTYYV